MSNWQRTKPQRIKGLQFYSLAVIILSLIEFVLWGMLLVSLSTVPLDFLIYAKILTLFFDIALALNVITLIKKHFPDLLPPVRLQYRFLLFLYLSVFSLILYLSFIYQFFMTLFLLEDFIEGVVFSNEIFAPILIVILCLLKTLSMILTQIGGFKLIKEIRTNSKRDIDEHKNFL